MRDIVLHKVTLFWEARLLNYLQAKGLSTLELKTMEKFCTRLGEPRSGGLILMDVSSSKALHGGGARLQSRRVLHFQG